MTADSKINSFEPGELAELVRCPQSHSRLVESGESLVCSDAECRLSFPIREGIPILLVEQATELDEGSWREIVEAGDAGQATEKTGEQA